jgi:hypothetical protein
MDSLRGLPERDADNVDQLVQVGEWQVALGNLCTQLYEYDMKVPRDTLSAISELGREVGVEERYWSVLTPEPKGRA